MSGKDFIHRAPLTQPSRGEKPQPRDFTEISRRVTELSEAISVEQRPHLSSRFIEKEEGTNDAVALTLGQLNGVVHGLGREYRGWHLASVDTAAMVWEASDTYLTTAGITVDKTVYLPLMCSASCNIKLVVW